MKVKETQLANHICFWLLKWGALAFIHDSVGIYDPSVKRFRKNQNPFRIPGVADILGVCGPGRAPHLSGFADWPFETAWRPLACEVKLPGNTQSDEQIAFQERWVKAGGVYVLAYSLLDVKTQLKLPDTIEWPKVNGPSNSREN